MQARMLRTLVHSDFQDIIDDGTPVFIVFFAPWCPACMNLLPEFRKASILTGGSVVFGTANCTATITVFAPTRPPCSSIKADRTLADFVKKIVKPSVISLSFDEFYDRVGDKDEDEMWLIDTPWCGLCMQCRPFSRTLLRSHSNTAFCKDRSRPSLIFTCHDCFKNYSGLRL